MINLISISGDVDLRVKLDEHFNGYKVNVKTYIISKIVRAIMTGKMRKLLHSKCINDYLVNLNKIKFLNETDIKWDNNLKLIESLNDDEDFDEDYVERAIRRMNRRVDRILKEEEIERNGFSYPQRDYCLNGMFPVPTEDRYSKDLMDKWCIENWGSKEEECFIKGRVGKSISIYRLACVHNLEPLAKNISYSNKVDLIHYYFDGETIVKKTYVSGEVAEEIVNNEIYDFVQYCKKLF